jgi:hypothetical protein
MLSVFLPFSNIHLVCLPRPDPLLFGSLTIDIQRAFFVFEFAAVTYRVCKTDVVPLACARRALWMVVRSLYMWHVVIYTIFPG